MPRNITIGTSEKVIRKVELATPWRRITEYVVDQFIVQLIYVLIIIIVQIAYAAESNEGPAFGGEEPAATIAIYYVLNFFMQYVYYFLIELIFNGRTFGKMLVDLRTIDLHGGKATALQLLVRNFFRVLPPFIEGIFIFFTRNNMRLGDIVAGTIVVNNEKETRPHLIDTEGYTLNVKTSQLNALDENEWQAIALYLKSFSDMVYGAVMETEKLLIERIDEKIGLKRPEDMPAEVFFQLLFNKKEMLK